MVFFPFRVFSFQYGSVVPQVARKRDAKRHTDETNDQGGRGDHLRPTVLEAERGQ
jgi:hypothetical protein